MTLLIANFWWEKEQEVANELGDQCMSDQEESSPSGGVLKGETTVDYSGLRDAVERSKEDTGSEYPQSLLRNL